jgi:hypothetical protein
VLSGQLPLPGKPWLAVRMADRSPRPTTAATQASQPRSQPSMYVDSARVEGIRGGVGQMMVIVASLSVAVAVACSWCAQTFPTFGVFASGWTPVRGAWPTVQSEGRHVSHSSTGTARWAAPSLAVRGGQASVWIYQDRSIYTEQ